MHEDGVLPAAPMPHEPAFGTSAAIQNLADGKGNDTWKGEEEVEEVEEKDTEVKHDSPRERKRKVPP